MSFFVHETAIVDDGVEIGDGTKIWHWVHVSKGATIGERCVLGQNVFIAPGVALGNLVKIQNNVSVYAGVEIGDEVFLGPSCVFTNVNNPRAHVERKDEFLMTNVGRGASVGANATIVCGHDIGQYAFVGAGSVVTHHVPPHAMVYGNPARVRAWVCRCGEKLTDIAAIRDSTVPSTGTDDADGHHKTLHHETCGRCGDRYALTPERCMRLED